MLLDIQNLSASLEDGKQILNGLSLEDSASINYINTFCFY